jgi:hypothetical protein
MPDETNILRCIIPERDFEDMSDAVISAVADSVPEGVYGIIVLSNNDGRVCVRTNFPHQPSNIEAAVYMLREAADNMEKAYGVGKRPTQGADRGDTDLRGQGVPVQDDGPADPPAG